MAACTCDSLAARFTITAAVARPSMRLPLTIELFFHRPMWPALWSVHWGSCRDCGHNHDHDSWIMMTLMCVWLKLFREMCLAWQSMRCNYASILSFTVIIIIFIRFFMFLSLALPLSLSFSSERKHLHSSKRWTADWRPSATKILREDEWEADERWHL